DMRVVFVRSICANATQLWQLRLLFDNAFRSASSPSEETTELIEAENEGG
ncbi:17199_t:CDS:2, partial [Cetraspora pellucida]